LDLSRRSRYLASIPTSVLHSIKLNLINTESTLSPCNNYKSLKPNDIPAILLVRNDRPFLPSLLQHYRKIGVDRFLIVDDQSEDGSTEYLLSQPDVNLHHSHLRYGAAARGKIWRNELLKRYGTKRWYLSIDSDEYLLYNDMDNFNLRDLIRWLEQKRMKRLASFMLDFYPELRIREAQYSEGEEPWKLANHFDAEGYQVENHRLGIKITGGVRGHTFGLRPMLQKFPLFYNDCLTGYFKTIHFPSPYWRNFGPVYSVLAHFKFFGDFLERASNAVLDKNYWSGARHYQVQHKKISEDPNFTFMTPESVKYTGPSQFAELGLAKKIVW